MTKKNTNSSQNIFRNSRTILRQIQLNFEQFSKSALKVTKLFSKVIAVLWNWKQMSFHFSYTPMPEYVCFLNKMTKEEYQLKPKYLSKQFHHSQSWTISQISPKGTESIIKSDFRVVKLKSNCFLLISVIRQYLKQFALCTK